MNLPEEHGTIFFVHRGPVAAYLVAAALQARLANPATAIIFMSDQPEKGLGDVLRQAVTTVSLRDFSTGASRFAQTFRFDGINSYDYELMNFQRWFLIEEYCAVEKIKGPILMLDSDAFLYLSVKLVAEGLTSHQTVVDDIGPQFSFFSDSSAVSAFTRYVTGVFSTPENFSAVKNFVDDYANPGLPNVSDMAVLGLYAQENHLEDLGKADRTDFIFCENIGAPQGLRSGALGKKIQWEGRLRFFVTPNGAKVLAGGVHLQGGNKVLWPFFVDGPVHRGIFSDTPLEYLSAIARAVGKATHVGLLRVAARLRRARHHVVTSPRKANTND